MRRTWKILIALALVVGLLPGMGTAAMADGEPCIVILDPGDGTGAPITYSSADGISTGNWKTAGNCQFYYEGDGSLAFRLHDNYCPDTFKAPDAAHAFDGWTGNTQYNKLSAKETTFVARWKFDESTLEQGSYALSPAAYTIDGPGYTDIPCTLESLILKQLYDNDSIRQVDGIDFVLNSGAVEDKRGNRIPFLAAGGAHGEPRDRAQIRRTMSSPGSTTNMVIWIDPEGYASAVPGTYTGTLNYDSVWAPRMAPGKPGQIALTLVVPEVAATSFTVTVNHGTGSGRYPQGDRVAITADEPAADKQFKEWAGADGLVFTSGNSTSASASFIMPHEDVTLTATYEDAVPQTDPPATELKSIRLSKNGRKAISKATVKKGKKLKLMVITDPAGFKTTFTFKSSKPKVATVSKKGVVKGKKKGKTTITVTAPNGMTARIKVTVK